MIRRPLSETAATRSGARARRPAPGRPSSLRPSPVRSLLACAALLAATAGAAPQVVENPAEPAHGLQVARLTELWRAGGEDDDVIFGNVGGVTADAAGDILVLDSQLSQVNVFGPDGTWLRAIGHEGDGPGEVRQPGGMFLTPDGTVCLLQTFPGRIVKITGDGLPAGEAAYKESPDSQSQFGVVNSAYYDPAGMVLVGIRMAFDGGISKQTYFLARCDADGLQQQAFLEKEHVINYADFVLDEAAMDFVWSRYAADGHGLIAVAPERYTYRVDVYGADGARKLSFGRAYEVPERTEEQKKIARQIIEGVGAYYPTPPREITIEPREQVVTGLRFDPQGRIWVGTSRGVLDCPAGTWQVMDVFTPDGHFDRQVAIPGDYDPNHDSLTLLPDGRAVVVAGALNAFLMQQGVTGGEEADTSEEIKPLELICYRLELD